MLWCQALLGLVFIIGWEINVLGSPLDHDYTSGELLDHSLAWAETGILYPSIKNPPYRVLNYPPVYLALVRVLQKIGISALLAGRLISLMAFFLATAIIYQWLRTLGMQWKHTLLLMLAFLGSSYPVVYYIGQFHLQWLAVALSLLGFYLIRNPNRLESVLAGGIALALACFVKQTQVFLALWAGLWLLLYHRRAFLVFALAIAGIGFVGSFWLHQVFGQEIWRHLITYTVGTFTFSQFFQSLIDYFLPWALFPALAFWLGIRESNSQKDLRWWYFIGSSLWLLSTARQGSAGQYWIEWSCALLLWLAPFLERWINEEIKFNKLTTIFSILFFFQFLGADFNVAWCLVKKGKDLKNTVSYLPTLCQALPQDGALVLVEEAGLARACKHETILHPFIMSNLSQRGLWDEKPFVAQLNQKKFPVIFLLFDPRVGPTSTEAERWTPAMAHAFASHYRVEAKYGKWWVLRP